MPSLEIVILKDMKDNYYALTKEELKSARVPDEYRADIDQLIEEQGQGELSDEQLESVVGGAGELSHIVTFEAPTRLSIGAGGARTWAHRPL